MRLLLLALFGAALLGTSGCATHMQSMGSVRYPLYAGDVPRATQNFELKKQKDNDLLYLLEKAHLFHMNGQWTDSNMTFEKAERLSDELYTKSLSRQLLSVVTSDKTLPYTGSLYELSLIPYYRALNYQNLNQPDEALVEARKANLKINGWSQKAADKNLNPMAFLQYITGLLYAGSGQWDDALISYRAAIPLYSKLANIPTPPSLTADYYAAAKKAGRAGELADLVAKDPALPARAAAAAKQNVIVFIETGFVPYKSEVTITLPLLELRQGESTSGLAQRYVNQFGASLFGYQHTQIRLKQILQFAFPIMEDFPARIVSCEAGMLSGNSQAPQPLLDLGPLAHDDFGRQIPGIFMRTVLRAIAKEMARHETAKKNNLLGWAVNLLNITTEQADTRSWFMLPRQLSMVKLTVPTGSPQTLVVRSLSDRGFVVDEKRIPVTLKPGEVRWLSARFFQ